MDLQSEQSVKKTQGIRKYLVLTSAAFAIGLMAMAPFRLYQLYSENNAESAAAMTSHAEFLASLDQNKDGELSLDEMLDATVKNVMLFDKNNSGDLDMTEFSASLGLKGEAGQEAALYYIAFKEADTNKDGVLTADEIRNYVMPGLSELYAESDAHNRDKAPKTSK